MVSSKFAHRRRSHKTPKFCKPPPPIPPPPPPVQSYADAHIKWEDYDEEEEEWLGPWEYQRRIYLQLNDAGTWYEEKDPPPCPNVYCRIQRPEAENATAHIDLELWGDNCDQVHTKTTTIEIDVPDEPDSPWTGECNDWDYTDEYNLGGSLAFVLYPGPGE